VYINGEQDFLTKAVFLNSGLWEGR